ncbi:MAG: hypothetical protein AB7R89_02635 [Dehalococcoidia bacterium]
MLRSTLVLTLVACGMVLAACGGSSDSDQAAAPLPTATSDAAQSPTTGYGPVVAASELVVGENRFVLGIIDNATGQPVPDAKVHLRFFTLQGDQGTLKSEADATFIAPARDAGVTGIIEHRHADGSVHPHANVEADVGVYVTHATFDQAGPWGVEATFMTRDGQAGKVATRFDVQPQSTSPAVGSQAPRTDNPTAADVKNLTEIDSAVEPVAALHQESVADAIAAGKPALVAFVTPGYCSTRFCGPTYELVKKLIPEYGDKAALIHVEIYKDPINKVVADSVREWKLQSEPYIFILDRNGTITDKFEGPVSLSELEEALGNVVS